MINSTERRFGLSCSAFEQRSKFLIQIIMAYPSSYEAIEDIKEALQTAGPASAAVKIQEHLDKLNNVPLNIAITGESGSGKSSFVNAFRGVDHKNKERAAPTDCVETTIEVRPYHHPKHPNVTLWDLPGIGTPNFLANEYLKKVEFEKFDFFIIISADRFRENDVKLALEIQKMKKKFYFVRSKIDNNLKAEKHSKTDYNEKDTLERIRKNCIQGLQNQGFESPQVFLVSNFHHCLYDFSELHNVLDRELPAHKRNALLLAVPNISLEIINMKKKALQTNIKYYAWKSALIAGAPIPGLSFVADLNILADTTKMYQVTFGLDSESLKNLADATSVPLDDLRAVMKSQLAEKIITKDLIIKMLSLPSSGAIIMAGGKAARFTSLFAIPVSMALSFTLSYGALYFFLNILAEDAQRVFTKALGLNT